MSPEEICYVSQIAASAALLASVIYLALQTRQTARGAVWSASRTKGTACSSR